MKSNYILIINKGIYKEKRVNLEYISYFIKIFPYVQYSPILTFIAGTETLKSSASLFTILS